MSPPPPQRRPIGRLTKVLSGALVFLSIIVAWPHIESRLARGQPLPDGGDAGGACTIWFVGSSTIYRWTSMARDMSPWLAHNRGVMGASVDDVAARMAVEKPGSVPGTVVFYIGENDIADGASAADVARTLDATIQTVRRRLPTVRIIVAGLKPSPTRWTMRPEQLRFNAIIRSAMQGQAGVAYIDPGSTLLIDGVPGPFYVADGVHLNDDGYRLWGRAIRSAIQSLTPAATIARCAGKARSTQ